MLHRNDPSALSKLIKRSSANMLKATSWLTALLGVGTMEGFFRLAPHIGLSKIDNTTMNGTYIFPPGKKSSLFGSLMFYTSSVGLVSLFKAVRPKIKGSPPIQSLKYGTALFFLSSLVAMPLVSATNPYMRKGSIKKPGLFGLGLDGWKTPVTNFIGHMIFCQVIGFNTRKK